MGLFAGLSGFLGKEELGLLGSAYDRGRGKMGFAEEGLEDDFIWGIYWVLWVRGGSTNHSDKQ